MTGVSLRSVKRIAKEPELSQTTDAEERRRRGIGRPSIVVAYKPLVTDLLRDDPRMKSAAILRRTRSAGYVGGKSAMYALIASLRRSTDLGASPSVAAGRAVAEGHRQQVG